MSVVMCTQQLWKRIAPKEKLPRLEDVDGSTTGCLGNWSAKSVTLRRRPHVVFANEKTLLCVLVPLSPSKSLFGRFAESVRRELERLEIDHEAIDAEMRDLADLRFARNSDRRLLGSLNELAYMARAYAEDELWQGDPDGYELMNAKLNHTPHPTREPAFAMDAVRDLYGLPKLGKEFRPRSELAQGGARHALYEPRSIVVRDVRTHKPDIDPLFVVLGWLEEYAGRSIADSAIVERFWPQEKERAPRFADRLRQLAEWHGVDAQVGVVELGEGSRAVVAPKLRRIVDECYGRVRKDPVTIEDEVVMVGRAYVREAMLGPGDLDARFSYVLGAYERYGDGWSIRLTNADHKAQLLRQLLVELGCDEVVWRSACGVPRLQSIEFVPTDALRKLLAPPPIVPHDSAANTNS